MKRFALTAAVAALALTAALPGLAAPKMMHASPMAAHSKMMPSKMSHSKMAASKMVYVCTKCKEYWTPTQAKKMGYKDSMGHKLTKMSKKPAGFMAGGKMGSM